uniref:Enoyl-CoA hydratase n=1 Tax=Dendroctonus ponderosae TaxID=77166 RepID=J3JV38_DENPD|nr:unknown [Dendroctonus ponderosae]
MGTNCLLLSFRNGVRKILFNRPEKRNAFNGEMYQLLTKTLNDDAQNDKIVVTILTGAGSFYSSGTDLNPNAANGSLEDYMKLVQAFIDYPKLLIAVVNGPAIGIAATTAALCDILYASDAAHFETPFLRLGLCAEGASSYTFPRTLGRSRASEILFLSKKMSAKEACDVGLISRVIPHNQLDSFINSLYEYGSLPVNAVKINKKLIMHELKGIFTEANIREFESLETCIGSEEFANALMSFMQKKKSKL